LPKDLSLLCDKVYVPNSRRVPSAYSSEEVDSLLNAVDTSNPVGKRDYAILILAARLGLRISDIRLLAFENIDWVSNQIRLTQCKTENEVVLPFSEEIGWAIIDYVRDARPKTESRYVFVRHTPPHEAFSSSYNFTYMIGKYFHRAGIFVPPGKHHGLHSLRHSLASNMLATGAPLPIVSDVLGHSDTKSTSTYLKVDITQLRDCALDIDFGGDNQ